MTIIVIAVAAVAVTTHAVITCRLTGMIAAKTGTVTFTSMAAISCTHAATVATSVAASVSTAVATATPFTPCVS